MQRVARVCLPPISVRRMDGSNRRNDSHKLQEASYKTGQIEPPSTGGFAKMPRTQRNTERKEEAAWVVIDMVGAERLLLRDYCGVVESCGCG